MPNFLQNEPVFYTLLVLGLLIALLACLRGNNPIAKVVFPILIGNQVGNLAVRIEYSQHHKKQNKEYHPTQIPIYLFILLNLITLILTDTMLNLLISSSAYFITLAIATRVYEIRTNRKGVTWKDFEGAEALHPISQQ